LHVATVLTIIWNGLICTHLQVVYKLHIWHNYVNLWPSGRWIANGNIVQMAFIQNLSRALFCSIPQIMLLLLLDVGYVVPRDVSARHMVFLLMLALLALPTKARVLCLDSL
jgi:hypothetical protein